jgi:hypothetical protein
VPAEFTVDDVMVRLAGTQLGLCWRGAPFGATLDSNTAPGFWQASGLHTLTRRSLVGGAAAMVLVRHAVPGLTSSDRLYPANTLFPGG